MRNANPDQLDELAKLLDGRGGAGDGLDEAFTRASALGVSSKLTPLRPMRTWAAETAPDLRKRAHIARLEDGDPEAGAKWAGFSAGELKDAGLMILAPDVLILAATMGVSEEPGAEFFRRRSNESWHDWVDRVRAHGVVGAMPALKPYEGQIKEIFGLAGDVNGVWDYGRKGAFYGGYLTKVMVGNSFVRGGWLNGLKMWTAGRMEAAARSGWASERVARWGAGLRNWTPAVRSLAAPGSWLPGKLAALASGNATYQDITRIPFVNTQIANQLGEAVDLVRSSRFMSSPVAFGVSGNRAIDVLVGSDKLAKMYGGLTHAGDIPGRAGNASLWKVTRNAAAESRLFGKGRLASLGSGLSTASKAGGAIRIFGAAGSAVATGFSIANVWAQGNPADAYHEKGAGYVADVAEVFFNASMTAAMVAPNPWTIGAVAVTGLVYGGAKIVQHWEGIKAGAVKAWDGATGKAKAAAKKLNPFKW